LTAGHNLQYAYNYPRNFKFVNPLKIKMFMFVMLPNDGITKCKN